MLAINAGLPDFSRYDIPKREKIFQLTIKYSQWPQNIPNGSEIEQVDIKGTNIIHCKTLEFYPNWIFLFENMPSGNPVSTFVLSS
jgi:hypothetical protein